MQKKSLRQAAMHYLQNNRTGSLRDKKQRHYVIHKLINDLFYLGNVPATWDTLPPLHIHKLVALWKKRKTKTSTIVNHMVIIRHFLMSMDYDTSMLTNQSLGLIKKVKNKKQLKINAEVLEQIQSPIACVLLGLQMHFGLTLSEAMRMMPSIHIQEHQLWLTREITFNHEDRFVPIQTSEQKKVLKELTEVTKAHKNLIETHGYDAIRAIWRDALRELKFPTQRNHRYVYARLRQKTLITKLTYYKARLTIMDEMGIKSRTTLWEYLHDAS